MICKDLMAFPTKLFLISWGIFAAQTSPKKCKGKVHRVTAMHHVKPVNIDSQLFMDNTRNAQLASN